MASALTFIGSTATGDVAGPASSTDNAVARFDGTGGKTLQNSSVTIDDQGNIALPLNMSLVIGTGRIGWIAATGATWTDSDLEATLRHNVQSLSANRTVTWPDAAGTVTLLGNTATGTGSVVLATSPTFATSIIMPGGLIFIGYTSSAAGATTTELPTDKMLSIHKNTNTGAVHLAFNDGGATIKSVQLS